jgi:hypothetical protein
MLSLMLTDLSTAKANYLFHRQPTSDNADNAALLCFSRELAEPIFQLITKKK